MAEMRIEIIAVDTVTKLDAAHRGQVLVGGSHGGIYAGHLAAKAGCRAVILNDAGVGKDAAGIGSLAYLDAIAMAAATVGHDSARIGDGADMQARGIISHVNDTAAALGCAAGQTAHACADLMRAAAMPRGELPAYREARFLFEELFGEPRIWGLDSASLVRDDDAGQILITASHGALLGGESGVAIKADVLACSFNDAGVGIERAGIGRLAALDGRGIAAVAIDCRTARIGDSRSHWATGRVSHANETARNTGVEAGMRCPEFADAVLGAYRKAKES